MTGACSTLSDWSMMFRSTAMAISAVYAPVQAEVILTVRRWARNEAWKFWAPVEPMHGLKLSCLILFDHDHTKMIKKNVHWTQSATKLGLTKPYWWGPSICGDIRLRSAMAFKEYGGKIWSCSFAHAIERALDAVTSLPSSGSTCWGMHMPKKDVKQMSLNMFIFKITSKSERFRN